MLCVGELYAAARTVHIWMRNVSLFFVEKSEHQYDVKHVIHNEIMCRKSLDCLVWMSEAAE